MMMGRWHGSFGTAGKEVLERELAVSRSAVRRLAAEIRERRKLIAEHQKNGRKIRRRIRQLEAS